MFVRAILVGVLAQLLVFGVGVSKINFANIHVTGHSVKIPGSALFKYHTEIGTLIGNFAVIEDELKPFVQPWAGATYDRLDMENYKRFLDYLTAGQLAENERLIDDWIRFSFLGFLVSPLYILAFLWLSKSQKDVKHIRGAEMISPEKFNKSLAKAAADSPVPNLTIGDIVWPHELESKHMLILGTSGSGKGVLMNQLVRQINRRKYKQRTGERAIFYDLKGEFIAKQMQKGDLIFCPFDSRSLRWNIFNEIESLPDFDVLAKSLFAPEAAVSEPYWQNAAADLFRTGLMVLKMRGTTSNNDLWEFFSQPVGEMKKAFFTLPLAERGAAKHIDKDDSTTSSSLISVLQNGIKFFRYLTDLDGDFSFRQYIREQRQGVQPNLFILNVDQYAEVFKPLMTLAINIMVRETLSLPDDLNRRIWFVLDELGTLSRMDSIIRLETVGRSKGACIICANQDLGRIEEVYGQANKQSFFNNFNTTLTFRIREPQTTDFLSQSIGERQVIKVSRSKQMSPSDLGDRKSESEQEKIERLVMPAEFQALPDLTAIANIAGFGVSKITVPPIFFKERHPNFVMRDFPELIGPEKPAPDPVGTAPAAPGAAIKNEATTAPQDAPPIQKKRLGEL
jgi:type IV secretory pathway TraG/TraD family ATPase VirD4